MNPQAVGQRQAAVGAKLEAVMQSRFFAELDGVQQTDADRWPELVVVVSGLELADQQAGRPGGLLRSYRRAE